MTVGREAARRRWVLVATVAALLCALPVAVRVWPVRAPALATETLRTRIQASGRQPFQGYALSSGSMGLPELPQLGQISAMLSGTTQLRGWYAGPDRWRVDVIDTGTERGVYRTRDAEYQWDYGANQLTLVAGA